MHASVNFASVSIFQVYYIMLGILLSSVRDAGTIQRLYSQLFFQWSSSSLPIFEFWICRCLTQGWPPKRLDRQLMFIRVICESLWDWKVGKIQIFSQLCFNAKLMVFLCWICRCITGWPTKHHPNKIVSTCRGQHQSTGRRRSAEGTSSEQHSVQQHSHGVQCSLHPEVQR